jgi:succinate dehydrogenase / fumarate reductase, iron-sulfur subunit
VRLREQDRLDPGRCRTIFNCTEACRRETRITKAIGEVKKGILKGSPDIPVRQAAADDG